MNRSKQAAYAALVAGRKTCHACMGLTNPADYAAGRYDSPEIGPWTRWQGNLDATLMIVGQDWGDTAYFARHDGLDGSTNPTNRTLCRLLHSIGIHIDPQATVAGRGQIFLTNTILCLKSGGMQATVAAQWSVTVVCASSDRRLRWSGQESW